MRYKHTLFFIFIALFFVACTSDTNEETPYIAPPAVVDTNTTTIVDDDATVDTNNTIDVNGTLTVTFADAVSTRELTVNSEFTSIEVLVFGANNAPYTGGTISIAFPQKVLSGVDVGSFSSQEVDVVDGKAVFNYTGPKDLQVLVESNDTSTVFGFYHSSSAASVKDFTFNYAPVANQIVLDTYSLGSSLSDGNITLGLQSSKFISFYVENDAGTKVDSSKITSIKVEVLNTPLAELRDTLGNSGDTLTFTGDNDISLSIESNTISGLVPIRVTSAFQDANDKNLTIEEIFNVVVLSGPPTAMSISYAGVTHDEEYAKFQEHFVVTVTDKYFNPVNTSPAITTGAIVGYLKDATTQENIFYRPDSNTTGRLNHTNNIFDTNNSVDFSNMMIGATGERNDYLVTFGLGYTYDASGKWDVTTVGAANNNELIVIDGYDSNITRSNLGFAVGNNFRQDICRGSEWIGTVKVTDGSYKLDARGMAKITLDYDYYLTGKDIVLWVNIVGFTAETGIEGKFGEATEHTLRGIGFKDAGVSVSAGVTNATYRIYIEIDNVEEWYRNANFGYKLTLSDNLTLIAVSSSNGNITDCAQSGGVAYVDVTVTENDAIAGSISITEIAVSDEFEN